jgi:antibiotic biosynthesis monooxygenase (ABM) superfamily enzyme
MFGLDIKSLIVGVLLAWFVIPWIQRMIASRSAGKATTA